MFTSNHLIGLAFPVVTVKYFGPTNHRGSYWKATLRHDATRFFTATASYEDAETGARNHMTVAIACFTKYLEWSHSLDTADHFVAIPGNLNADAYVFTMVPTHYFK